MTADAVLIAQWIVLALLATALLALWGDLGGVPFVRRLPGGVKFVVGVLLLAGMVAALAAPNYLTSSGGVSGSAPIELAWPLVNVADGGDVDLQSLQGKVLFINVWATWCPPCVAELPSIEALHREFAGRNDVAFLLISQDRSAQIAKEFAEKRSLKAPVYYPKGPMPAAFRTEGIPATFIVGKDARLRASLIGGRDWSQPTWAKQLEELAAQELPAAKGEGAGR